MFKTFLRKTSIRRLPAIIQRDKKFVFDLLRLNTVCPAALRSAYPFLVKTYLKNMTTNHVGNWGANCPDHIKNITLGNNDADCLTSDIICEWGSDAYIQTKVACKNCSTFFSGTITDAAAKVGVPCPVLLNIAYGYYLTIRNGGELGFYSRDLHAAIFQCPNPKSRVVVKISRKDSSGVIALLVINIFGSGCNKKIKVGDEFIISENKLKGGFCLDAFNSLFLYSGISKFFTSPAIIHCIIGDCNAQWEIGHKK